MLTDFSLLADHSVYFVLIGSFVDVFFLTGYIFYGFALLSSVAILYASGLINASEVIIFAYIGTMTASYTNYAIGYYFGRTKLIKKITDGSKAQKIEKYFTDHRLLVVMIISRFVTLIRPAYMVVLGAMQIAPKRVLFYEAVIAFCWVTFWAGVFIFGSQVMLFITRVLFSII